MQREPEYGAAVRLEVGGVDAAGAVVGNPSGLRIALHDYGGYHFPVQLSRCLAARGHHVLHLYCASMAAPRAGLDSSEADAETFTVEQVHHQKRFERYRPFVRLRQEHEYGRRAAATAMRFRPDVVVSANTPLLSQRVLLAGAGRSNVPFVFWLQDLLGVGIQNVLMRRHRVAGRLAGLPFVRLEERMLARSDFVVAISDDFVRHLAARRVGTRIATIENWAPLMDSHSVPRLNGWRRRAGLGNERLVLYAGTLGYKHDPELLRYLAQQLRPQSDVTVVVVSEGPGAEWLRERKDAEGLENLVLLGYQPPSQIPEMFAAADVFITVLKADAGPFSVPSKVLTSLSAGRPIVAALPAQNLAARVIGRARAGLVVDPAAPEAFVSAICELLDSDEARDAMSAAGRAYAEATFDIELIADRFEEVLGRVVSDTRRANGVPVSSQADLGDSS